MSDIKQKYPVTSTVAITAAIASLASDTNLLAGRASTAVDNTTNQDLDHLVSGAIVVGTTPTANTSIEVWAYAYQSLATGTPTYPDSITGTDAAKTLTNIGVKSGILRWVATLLVPAATSNVVYSFAPVSIANLFGALPQFYGIFIVHNTGVALNAAGHSVVYNRIQAQTV